MNVIKETQSLCPECLKILSATIFERDNKVWITKKCPEHGEFEELFVAVDRKSKLYRRKGGLHGLEVVANELGV